MTKKGIRVGLLLSCVIWSQVAFAQVARSDSGTTFTGTDSFVTTLSLTTLTVTPGANLCLVAGLLSGFNNPTISSFDWDSGGTPQAMTQAATVTIAGVTLYAYVLPNPHTGNKTLTANFTGATGTIFAAAFSSADQSTCIVGADTVTNSGNSTAPTTGPVTSSADGATLGMAGNAGSINFTTPIAQMVVFTDNSLTFTGSAATDAFGGSSATHSWTFGASTNWAAIGLHIKAASAASTPLSKVVGRKIF